MKLNIEKLIEMKNDLIGVCMSQARPRYMAENMEETMKGLKLLADIDVECDNVLMDYKKTFEYIEATNKEVETIKKRLDNQEEILKDIRMLLEQNKEQ